MSHRELWNMAKIAFYVVGGGSAGYFAIKGVNTFVDKVSEFAQLQLLQKMAASGRANSGDVDSLIPDENA